MHTCTGCFACACMCADGFVYVDIVATTGGVSADHMSSVSQTVMQTVSSLTEGAKEVKVSILGTYLELRIPAQVRSVHNGPGV